MDGKVFWIVLILLFLLWFLMLFDGAADDADTLNGAVYYMLR